jgi:S1-C subfamily serine protease
MRPILSTAVTEARVRPRPDRPVLAAAAALALTAALVGAPTPASAAAGDDETLISTIEQASPAVVTIQTTGPAGAMSPFPDGEMPFGDMLPRGTGSGVIIDPDGLILTNGHVVSGADAVSVFLADGEVIDGRVVGVDTLTDFAFVRVDAEDLPTLPLGDSSGVRVGQRAIVIGNPLGQFPGSVSVGIVSGLDRDITVFGFDGGGGRLRHLIQTDAAVNPGNSGGAIIDGDGDLIAIATARGGRSEGIGFGLPIDLAKPIIDQARAGDRITRPWLGVVYQDITPQVAAEAGLDVRQGAYIGSLVGEEPEPAIVADSPADEAGLEAGDVITTVAGDRIDADNPLDLLLLKHAPGEEITLEVLRDGESRQIDVTLGTRPTDLAR